MKVKYIGCKNSIFKRGKIYEVLTIEDGWYRIMNEEKEEKLLPPSAFEIVDGEEKNVVLIIADALYA
ncbi:MAG: hypothetical protein IJZ93_02300 [Clostridia bacterium]|nr:hypothetical protein [Clostridia bacterium]